MQFPFPNELSTFCHAYGGGISIPKYCHVNIGDAKIAKCTTEVG